MFFQTETIIRQYFVDGPNSGRVMELDLITLFELVHASYAILRKKE